MSFISLTFIIFVAISLVIYYFVVPKKYQWYFLLLISYVFYVFAGWKLVFYLLFTTCSVFLCGLWISKTQKENRRKSIAVLAVGGNFSLLVLLKWINPIVGIGNKVFQLIGVPAFDVSKYSILLPLGISFYTFQAVGYLIDVYRNKIKPERNVLRFALFVSFFPQLIQGPISRHDELADQLYEPRDFSYEEMRRGFQLAMWGLFKKLVIADRLVNVTDLIFSDFDTYKGLYILIGAAVGVISVYADFSGGVDMARGVAQMFGINMPQNFERPFFATSLGEYWRRWHITLNNWWRDYLFYSLVLSKPISAVSRFTRKYISPQLGKVIGVYISINIVRTVNAMWHGAGVVRIINGLMMGMMMIIGLACAPVFKWITRSLKINTETFSWKLFQVLRTFFLICINRIVLKAENMHQWYELMKSLIKDFNPWILNYQTLYSIGLSERDVYIVIVSLLILLIVGILQEKGIPLRKTIERQNIGFQWAMLLTGILAIILWGCYGSRYDPATFVYQGF